MGDRGMQNRFSRRSHGWGRQWTCGLYPGLSLFPCFLAHLEYRRGRVIIAVSHCVECGDCFKQVTNLVGTMRHKPRGKKKTKSEEHQMTGTDIGGFGDLEKGEITVGQEIQGGFPREVGTEVGPEEWEASREKEERRGILDWGRVGVQDACPGHHE